MKPFNSNKWERMRAKGRKKYIIYNGVVGWGIPTAILYSILTTLWETQTIELNNEFFETLIISIILFPLGGIGFGIWTWHAFESNYQKNKMNKDI